MEIQKVKRKPREEVKTIQMSIRTTPIISDWMKDNNISPSRVFAEAIGELMEKKHESRKQN